MEVINHYEYEKIIVMLWGCGCWGNNIVVLSQSRYSFCLTRIFKMRKTQVVAKATVLLSLLIPALVQDQSRNTTSINSQSVVCMGLKCFVVMNVVSPW